MSRGVAHLGDDGREKETERIAWEPNGVETESEEPDLWVFEGLSYAIPRENFVSGSIAIFLESGDNVFPLLRTEELGSCGVVVYQEVCGDGVDDGENTLL